MLLALQNVSRCFIVKQGVFGQRESLMAVKDVSFTLEAGESVGLVGESGCGKSTLGRLASGLLNPTSGQILLENKKLPCATSRSWAAGKIQMVFQDPASSLNPRMRIGKSVAEPLVAKGEDAKTAFARATEILEEVGLSDAADRYPHQFSGGQRQRIAVARALITNPEVIICDEPVSALDASVQAQILNLLRDMQDRFKPAYVFISHDLAVVGFMCSRILVMYLGQIVEEATRENLFKTPAHPYSRALLAAMPKGARAWQQGKGVEELPPPLSGELPSPLHPPSGCHFHPRCPMAKTICSTMPPPWITIAEDWHCRCHFPELP